MKPANADNGPGCARWAPAVLFLAVVAHLVGTVLHVVPGHLSVDEVVYHWMTKSVADGWPWAIENGYRETQSRALEVSIGSGIKGHRGQLQGKYPLGYPLLAALPYRFVGFRALFLLNAAAFAVVLLLTWRLALRYLEPAWALTACAVWALGTFSWEYSQGAWPHVTALAFSLGGILLALQAFDNTVPRARRTLEIAAAGLLLGLAFTIRLDVAFLLGAVALVFLLAHPALYAELAWLGVGALPGFLAVAWDNSRKFGAWRLFSYGPGAIGLRRFRPLVAAVILLAAAAILRRVLPRLPRRRVVLAALFVVCAGTAAAAWRAQIWSALRGTYAVVVDMSAMDLHRLEPGMTRTTSGGVMYLGHFKKALLQSTPYLSLLLALGLRGHCAPGKPLWPLVALLFALLLVYGPGAWHGGLCLNQRYFLPVLPFTSVLTAVVLRDLLEGPERRIHRVPAAACVSGLALVFLVCMGVYALVAVPPEPFMMHFPLALALLATVSTVLFYAGPRRGRALAGRVAAAVLGAALGWSAATAFGYDLFATSQHRESNLRVSQALVPHLAPGSLLFVPVIDPFAGLIDCEVRLGNPWQDDFQSFRSLVRHYRDKGAPVYLATMGRPQLEQLKAEGRLEGLDLSERWQTGGYLVLEVENP